MFDRVYSFIQENIENIHIPTIKVTDVVEIAIISFVVYHIMVWIRKTKAWSLLKGLIVILGFLLLAAIFNMSTILWIAEKSFSVLLMVMVVVLQPELRRALEQLGQKNIFFSFLSSDANKQKGRYSDHTIDEIVKASFAMGRVKTGALMVFERNETLAEYEKTGIQIDAAVSSQLLINIFEHNTPLHDGAVIFRGDRIVSATCYLPLSDNRNLSKALGTRHRAAVGISEATDSLTVIVSEETGKVSVAYGGDLSSGLTQEGLREKLEMIQDKPQEETKRGWLERSRGDKAEKGERNGKKADK
ncbi:MAG: diadenylate cyclase CdaA [Lachnospiraceae bacterium]|nr:diadenylate cyclase CdaA [Lachnospiraceae bacterium]MBR6849580.1 diadenylate cyclase CdaA [Lachnospiraceae bacterium]